MCTIIIIFERNRNNNEYAQEYNKLVYIIQHRVVVAAAGILQVHIIIGTYYNNRCRCTIVFSIRQIRITVILVKFVYPAINCKRHVSMYR